MDLEALTIDVGDLQVQGFMAPKASTIDGGEVDLVMQGGGGREELPDLRHTEDCWETVCGLRANECEGVPLAPEDVLGEATEATVADAHGGRGEAVDVFAVQEVVLKFRCSNTGGGCVVELRE
jgi:hypothetical protein